VKNGGKRSRGDVQRVSEAPEAVGRAWPDAAGRARPVGPTRNLTRGAQRNTL